MLKMIKLGNLMYMPKLKTKKTEKVFDKTWKMWFPNEQERVEFCEAIRRAEEDVENGRVYTQEEVDKYFFEKYGV